MDNIRDSSGTIRSYDTKIPDLGAEFQGSGAWLDRHEYLARCHVVQAGPPRFGGRRTPRSFTTTVLASRVLRLTALRPTAGGARSCTVS